MSNQAQPESPILSVRYGLIGVYPGMNFGARYFNDWCRSLVDDERWNDYSLNASFALETDEPIQLWPTELGPRPAIIVPLTYIRAAARRSPLAVEMRWNSPERSKRIVMTGLEMPHSVDDVRRARAGIKIFGELERRGGRPPGTSLFRDRADFCAVVFPIIRELEQSGRRATEDLVLEYLSGQLRDRRAQVARQKDDVTARQLRRWFKQFGWREWDEVLSHALKS